MIAVYSSDVTQIVQLDRSTVRSRYVLLLVCKKYVVRDQIKLPLVRFVVDLLYDRPTVKNSSGGTPRIIYHHTWLTQP